MKLDVNKFVSEALTKAKEGGCCFSNEIDARLVMTGMTLQLNALMEMK